MLHKSKLALALAALGISSGLYAGMYAAPPAPTCTPGDVTVPCEAKKWDVGFRALYLKPVFDADAAYVSSATQNNHTQYNTYNQDWGWGFHLDVSYHFNTGNDLTVDWTHFDKDSNHNNLSGIYFDPTSQRFVSQGTFNASQNNNFDQVNFVMGQHVDMGVRKNARFYGGLQYARIRTEMLENFNRPGQIFNPGSGNSYSTRSLYSDTKGLGPVVGVDYSYDLGSGLSFVANAQSSLIYGNGRHTMTNLVTSVVSGSTSVARGDYYTKKSMIPSLEGQLGVNYAYAMPEGVLNLELGYQALNYFNALQTMGMNGAAAVLGRAPVADTDFALYGPYIGLKYVGDAVAMAPMKGEK